jgi:phenylacetate-CoA ligase
MPDISQKLYQVSPIWVQNIGISAYGMHLRRVRFSREFDRVFEEFMRRQWDSAETLKEYQNERLRILIAHAYENVPHYRRAMDERRLRPSEIRTVDDLPKMPILRKETIKNDGESLRARNFSQRQLWSGETSGTTGSPQVVRWDRHMVVVNAAAEWRQKSWAGLTRKDRVATIIGGRAVVPPKQVRPPFWRYNRPLRQMLFSAFHLRPENLPHYVMALQRFQPAALEAYPSTASLLARYVLDRRETLRLKCVLTSSESLLPHQRATIEAAFGCPVFDYYGMVERVVFATECEVHSGHHLNLDYGITEIVDDNSNPLPDGGLGYIVGTSLHNFGMPLIRYLTSDLTAIRRAPCACGRAFPLTENVIGRSGDFVVTPDGRRVPAATVELAAVGIRCIAEWQIIQEDRTHLVIKVVKDERASDDDAHKLVSNIEDLLGTGLKIELQSVAEIPRSRAHKHRLIISKIAAGIHNASGS